MEQTTLDASILPSIDPIRLKKPLLRTDIAAHKLKNFLQVCKIRVSAQAVCAKKRCTLDGNLTGNLAVTQEFPASVQADLHTPNSHHTIMKLKAHRQEIWTIISVIQFKGKHAVDLRFTFNRTLMSEVAFGYDERVAVTLSVYSAL